jgi:hypothetical protein
MTRTAADLVSGVATLDEFPGLEDVEGGGCALRQGLHDVADAVFDERDFEEVVAEDVTIPSTPVPLAAQPRKSKRTEYPVEEVGCAFSGCYASTLRPCSAL